jgi:hypothetical protein
VTGAGTWVCDDIYGKKAVTSATGSVQQNVEHGVRRFVTFYISNFPARASNVFLRKGFEVCGILDEVFGHHVVTRVVMFMVS